MSPLPPARAPLRPQLLGPAPGIREQSCPFLMSFLSLAGWPLAPWARGSGPPRCRMGKPLLCTPVSASNAASGHTLSVSGIPASRQAFPHPDGGGAAAPSGILDIPDLRASHVLGLGGEVETINNLPILFRAQFQLLQQTPRRVLITE